MSNTESKKVMMTVSIDLGTRHLIHEYGGSRGIGRQYLNSIMIIVS
jgi:hypothetical protein